MTPEELDHDRHVNWIRMQFTAWLRRRYGIEWVWSSETELLLAYNECWLIYTPADSAPQRPAVKVRVNFDDFAKYKAMRFHERPAMITRAFDDADYIWSNPLWTSPLWVSLMQKLESAKEKEARLERLIPDPNSPIFDTDFL